LTGGQQDALRRCWRHNLACAMVTELLADACFIDKGLGYTAGLLHDVGRMALISAQGDDYAELIGSQSDLLTLIEAEHDRFGINHCEAGRWLLENLGLPEEFQEVAALHHEPPDRDQLSAPGLVHIGSGTADMAGFNGVGSAPPWDATWPLSWFNDAIRDRFRDRVEELPLDIATRINAFDCNFLS
ncbi:MAG: HDOD domain-containing protein, partial [bacterium]|nr:HDOD domain-containing protein [bacterium]